MCEGPDVVFQWTGSFFLNSPGKICVTFVSDFPRTKYCLVILGQWPLWYLVLRMFQFTGSDMLYCKSQHCRSVVWMCSYTSFVSCGWARKLFMRSYKAWLGGGDQVKWVSGEKRRNSLFPWRLTRFNAVCAEHCLKSMLWYLVDGSQCFNVTYCLHSQEDTFLLDYTVS
jgi:hypothetical protein